MPPTRGTIVKAEENHEQLGGRSAPLQNGQENGRKLLLVRQDRRDVSKWNCTLKLQDITFEVMNYSDFGVAIYTEDANSLSAEYVDAPLILEGVEVSKLHLKKVRQEKFGERGVKIAFEVVGEPISHSRIDGIMKSKEILAEQMSRVKVDAALPEVFRRKVYELKDVLEQLEVSINELQETETYATNPEVQRFEATVAELVAEHLRDLFEPEYEALGRSLEGLTEDQVKSAFELFRRKVGKIIYASPFPDRGYHKPMGYPGDSEMMFYLYRNEAFGRSLFSKCVHRYFMNHPNGKAVRNRAQYLQEKLVQIIKSRKGNTPLKILSVASGPAEEIRKLVEAGINLDGVEIHLLDQDLSALRHAQREIRALCRKSGKNVEVKYFHKAIRNILAEGLEEEYDLIYSAGLFDYFSDPVAVKIAKRLYSHLKTAGTVIIGNFTAVLSNKMMMEMALDWYLIYRTEEDLRQLYAGVGASLNVEQEPERVNLFVVIKK